MEFHDFHIRAWTVDRKNAAVLVHSSPAGAMQRPEKVVLDWEGLGAFRKIFHLTSGSAPANATADPLIAGGRGLASVVFPDPVVGLLIRSLERIDPEDGLRVRLCLDGVLSDLPWEYLVLPDVAGPKSPGGFLALDARVSLVREPPQPNFKRNKGYYILAPGNAIPREKTYGRLPRRGTSSSRHWSRRAPSWRNKRFCRTKPTAERH
jgi:hypothetical protein